MRYCRYCGHRGHNIRSCSSLREQAAKDPNSWAALLLSKNKINSSSTRKCSYCKDSGHNRASCSKFSTDYVEMVKANAEFRKNMLSKMSKAGFGIGALVEQKYNDCLQLITEIAWDNINSDSIRTGWSGTSNVAFDGEEYCSGRIDPTRFSDNKYEDYYIRILEPASEESVVSSIPDGWLSGKSPKIDEHFGRKSR